jgi:hypothetical protein
MKTLTINCFNFTLGTIGIIDGKEKVKIENIGAESIYSTARNHNVDKIILIGPHSMTQKIREDLMYKYSFIQVEAIPN